jgi:hypothetical protein
MQMECSIILCLCFSFVIYVQLGLMFALLLSFITNQTAYFSLIGHHQVYKLCAKANFSIVIAVGFFYVGNICSNAHVQFMVLLICIWLSVYGSHKCFC